MDAGINPKITKGDFMSDQFGDRIKAYEAVWDQRLPARLPVILRLDGNSFSNFTKIVGFNKPFDERMFRAMWAAAEAVLKYCSGAQVAYTQSDEITILLRNDLTLNTDPFLANRVQKIASLCASVASVAFNKQLFTEGLEAEAIFDCRVFVVPVSEVTNVFLWRQLDAFKNCVSAYAYYMLAEKYGKGTAFKMLHGINTADKQELIFKEFGINVDKLPTHWKRGACISRVVYQISLLEAIGEEKLKVLLESNKIEDPNELVTRSNWKVDMEIPRFNTDRQYIERFLNV